MYVEDILQVDALFQVECNKTLNLLKWTSATRLLKNVRHPETESCKALRLRSPVYSASVSAKWKTTMTP